MSLSDCLAEVDERRTLFSHCLPLFRQVLADVRVLEDGVLHAQCTDIQLLQLLEDGTFFDQEKKKMEMERKKKRKEKGKKKFKTSSGKRMLGVEERGTYPRVEGLKPALRRPSLEWRIGAGVGLGVFVSQHVTVLRAFHDSVPPREPFFRQRMPRPIVDALCKGSLIITVTVTITAQNVAWGPCEREGSSG